jgi:hypothetical protein
MKYSFVLLTLIVGTVCGDEIGARITGFTNDGKYCPAHVLDNLYDECVVETAVALGASFDRRLELRGSRDLSPCDACPEAAKQMFGHWCYVMCPKRRLTLADEDPDRRLTNQGEIQQAARTCYDEKAALPKYKCLGKGSDGTADGLQIKIYYSEN